MHVPKTRKQWSRLNNPYEQYGYASPLVLIKNVKTHPKPYAPLERQHFVSGAILGIRDEVLR